MPTGQGVARKSVIKRSSRVVGSALWVSLKQAIEVSVVIKQINQVSAFNTYIISSINPQHSLVSVWGCVWWMVNDRWIPFDHKQLENSNVAMIYPRQICWSGILCPLLLSLVGENPHSCSSGLVSVPFYHKESLKYMFANSDCCHLSFLQLSS